MELFVPEESDVAWVNAIGRTTPGRELRNHITNLDFSFRNRGRSECSIQQVADFRRVFCYAFRKNHRCFNLPDQTPKFIAICNLSGYRGVFYSENPALIRLLCLTGCDLTQQTSSQVQQVIDHAKKNGCSVMLCLSLPWQAGVSQSFWEIRTLKRLDSGEVQDGQKCFSMSFEDDARAVTASNSSMNEDINTLKLQVEAFTNSMPTSCVDCSAEVVEQASRDGNLAKKCEQLQALVVGMKQNRQNVVDELNAARQQHVEALREKDRLADERVGKVAEASRRSDDLLKKRSAEMEAMNTNLITQVNNLTMKNRTMAAAKAEQELLFSTERQKLDTAAKLSAADAKLSTERLSDATRAIERERLQLGELHSRTVEDLERRLNTRTISERKATQRVVELQTTVERLDQVLEQLRTEKQAMTVENLRNQSIGARHESSVRRMRVLLGVALLACRKRREECNALQATLKSRAEKMRGDEIKQMLDTRSTGSTRDAVEAEMNTEPMQDPAELCELRADFARILDEKQALETQVVSMRTEMEDLKREVSRLKKKRPPKDFEAGADVVSAPKTLPQPSDLPTSVEYGVSRSGVAGNGDTSNGEMIPTTCKTSGSGVNAADTGNDANCANATVAGNVRSGDAALDTLVDNAHSAIRLLAESARQGAVHRRNAEQFYTELAIMRQFHWQAQPNGFLTQQGW